MRTNKSAIAVFIAGCLFFSVQAHCIVITPSNVVLPASAGDIFSFDFVVLDAIGIDAICFQSTINVSGAGTLILDGLSSTEVEKETSYWIKNSTTATAFNTEGNYVFGDDADFAELLGSNDIMARYAFIWDGTAGDYTFTLDLNANKSFVLKDDLSIEELQFNHGSYSGTYNSFTVNIPEPSTLIIVTLGYIAVRLHKKHGA